MEFRDDVLLGTKRLFSPALMNGGGCCKTIEQVQELSGSLAGGIIVGSITKEERTGNPGDVWWVGDGVALNSLSMPNGGKQYLVNHLPEMLTIAHDAGKVLIVNVVGFDLFEYCELTEICLKLGADAVELNLGCPNVVVGSHRKPIVSFNLDLMADILFRIDAICGVDAHIWVKVSPYSDPGLLANAAGIVKGFPVIKAVTVINTFPNAYGLSESGKSLITVGLAGLSGRALKHIGLGQVKQWHDALFGSRVSLIAVGGISAGVDIADYQAVGADAFQMTTELLKRGTLDPSPFERVASEYFDLPDR
jgi:dihydroorotate dehydrogenase (fumarate)